MTDPNRTASSMATLPDRLMDVRGKLVELGLDDAAETLGEAYAVLVGPEQVQEKGLAADDQSTASPELQDEIETIIRFHLDWPAERDRDEAIKDTLRDIKEDIGRVIEKRIAMTTQEGAPSALPAP